MSVVYNDTGYFEAQVTSNGRNTVTNRFNGRVLGSSANLLNQAAIESGEFRFPVLSQSSEVDIEILSSSHFPCNFQSAEWEGFFVMRSRRI
jgi:hypothetical protein